MFSRCIGPRDAPASTRACAKKVWSIVMTSTAQSSDDEYEDARIALVKARREEEKARERQGEARSRHERERTMVDRARKREAEARVQEGEARRRVDEATRRVEDARRRGSPQNRWETQARQSKAEGMQATRDAQRWGEEARRKELQLRPMSDQVRVRAAELADRTKETHRWEQRTKFLALRGGSGRPQSSGDGPVISAPPSEPEKVVPTPVQAPPPVLAGFAPLVVTEGAGAFLSQLLSGMDRQADQLLRFVADPNGSLTLALDVERQGDTVMGHSGTRVLLVESAPPEGLRGATLDVAQSSEGANLIISR